MRTRPIVAAVAEPPSSPSSSFSPSSPPSLPLWIINLAEIINRYIPSEDFSSNDFTKGHYEVHNSHRTAEKVFAGGGIEGLTARATTTSSGGGWSASGNGTAGGGGKHPHEHQFIAWRTIVWVVAGCFSFTACVLSIHLIFQHARHFSCPIVQSKIMGILWMVPIYSVDSWLSLRYPSQAVYIDMLRDCYEGYVIYLFIALMIAYLRINPSDPNGPVMDESVVVQQLRSVGSMHHAPPFSLCLPPIKLGREFLRSVKFAAMQYVVLKPILAVAGMCPLSLMIYRMDSSVSPYSFCLCNFFFFFLSFWFFSLSPSSVYPWPQLIKHASSFSFVFSSTS